jgi:hypothetical protein
LAHLLQKLIVAATFTGLAPGAPFSHKLHLKLKPQCASCHTAAVSSQKPSDNLLPATSVCRECHEQPPAIKAPQPTLVIHFSHAVHAKLGNVAPVIAAAIDSKAYLSLPADAIRKQLGTKNACAACHHGIQSGSALELRTVPRARTSPETRLPPRAHLRRRAQLSQDRQGRLRRVSRPQIHVSRLPPVGQASACPFAAYPALADFDSGRAISIPPLK